MNVVKIGGALLEDPSRAVEEIHRFADGPTVIVHGGGVQITRMLERMRVPSTFIDGLRVTDAKTLEAVAAALLGEVHTALIAALQRTGLPAVGIFGAIKASHKPGPWGLVGAALEADAECLNALLRAGKMPVIPTLALGPDSLLNVNGDETAAAIAVALGADQLIFLTDVEGVKNAEGKVIHQGMTPDELLQSSFVSGGMVPKLRAVKLALDGGIGSVRVGTTLFGSTA